MSTPSLLTSQWLSEQRRRQRQLLVIANPMAAPNPIPTLFANAPIRDYVKVYQGTPFENLAPLGPWLVRIDVSTMAALSALLQSPEHHWGWVASAEQLDMNEVVAHWQARMLIHDEDQRALYRFQDNRVISRHLQALDNEQIPLLLGPLCSALCWDGKQWISVDNPAPGTYPEPFDTPWLQVPPAAEQSAAAQQATLETWLWENHLDATQQLLTHESLATWLQVQLDKADSWDWYRQEQIHFLLEHQLNTDLANLPAWAPRAEETPDVHFLRAQQDILQANKGALA
ncbi:DUF4123 domain-containing protein [Pseudomonas fluorescens]|uniref:DUF4123 domain-containing protein n=1 Tax=Pseudomonas fluorescens TaxID=294 RepID=UPI0005C579CC|nr:DUF4123 domain-containing protein [Pseudomonas fluorescens]